MAKASQKDQKPETFKTTRCKDLKHETTLSKKKHEISQNVNSTRKLYHETGILIARKNKELPANPP